MRRWLISGLVLLTGCVEGISPNNPVDISTQPPRAVTGLITEIEFDTLSLRVDDGRQLVLSLEDSPVPEQELRGKMDRLQPVTITYTSKNSRLVPLTIVDAGAPRGPTPGSSPT